MLLAVAYFGVGALAAYQLTVLERKWDPANNPGRVGLVYQDVRFPARGDNLSIAGWYIPREGSRKAVVLVHGKGGSRTSEFYGHAVDFAKAMHDRGFAMLLIDLRGHGQSDDAHLSFGLTERRDVQGAVRWLEGQGFKPGSIGVIGISLGAATSIEATAEDPDIGALVEDSGYADIYPVLQAQWKPNSGLPDFMLTPTLWMGRLIFGYDAANSRPVDFIKRIAPRPVLIIHGTNDRIIPVEHGRQLQAADPAAELWIVDGAPHAGAYKLDPAGYVARISAFFDESLQ